MLHNTNCIIFLKVTIFFTLADSFHRSVHKSINCQKMNNLRDILYFTSKCTEIKYKISRKLLIFQ